MTISKAALIFSLALGAATPGLAQMGYGQPPTTQTQMEPPPRSQPQPAPQAAPSQTSRHYNLSRDEQRAFQPVLVAAAAHDWAAAQTALATAAPQARSADARYLVGQLHLQIGVGTNNTQLEAQAIDELLASGGALPDEMRRLYANQFEFAVQAGDTAKAENAANHLDEINPNDPDRLLRHVSLRVAAHDMAGALAVYQQAVQARQAANQPIPVEWRQQMASIAYHGQLPQTVALMREWLMAAPTPVLWHDSLVIYGETVSADSSMKLDIYRLVRAAGAMRSERDFILLADAAGDVRAIGEVKAVLEEGLSRNLMTRNAEYARERLAAVNPRIAADRASLPTERAAALAGADGQVALRLGDSYFGYGDYAQAAELFRAALQKGANAGLANMRLGEALAMAGQRAQAEAAFRQVSGPRAEIAQYWLFWLSTRPA
jgi:Tfp pilus assembly protein PilF